MVMSMNGHRQTNGGYGGNGNGTAVLPKDQAPEAQASAASLDLSLVDVREQIQKDDDGKWDAFVDRERLRMESGRLLVAGANVGDYGDELRLTPWAQSQLCSRLNIPTSYFRRCPAVLQDAQVNYWLKKGEVLEERDEAAYGAGGWNGQGSARESRRSFSTVSHSPRWLLRAKDDVLRGVLSDRYARLDNADFLDCLTPMLPERLEVKWFALGDESLHLRLIDPTLGREVLPDDRLMVGLHLGNSEVGKRSVTVDAIVWRLVCTNGMVRLVKGKSLLQQRHLYVSSSGFRSALGKAMSEALATGAGLLERMAQSTREHLDDIESVVEKLGQKWNLSQSFQSQILENLKRERPSQQSSIYGLANAVTQSAQLLPPDDRYGLEVLAGELMEGGAAWFQGGGRRKTVMPEPHSLAHDDASGAVPRRQLEPHDEEKNGTSVAKANEPGRMAKAVVEAEPDNAVVNATGVNAARNSLPVNQAKETFKQEEVKPVSVTQLQLIGELVTRRGLRSYDLAYLLEENFEKQDVRELWHGEARQLIGWLQHRPFSELLAPMPEADSDEEE